MSKTCVWTIANRTKAALENNDTPETRKKVVATAKHHGFWTVWMTVFSDDVDMLDRFANAYG